MSATVLKKIFGIIPGGGRTAFKLTGGTFPEDRGKRECHFCGVKAAAALLLFAGAFAIYGLTHDRSYFFDSLLTALSLQRPLFSGPAAALFSWNHFLWLPLTRLMFILLNVFGVTSDPYASVQWLNTCAGALLLVLIYRFLSGRIHFAWAFLFALLAGSSHVVWLRSSTGDPYIAGTLFSAAACLLITELREKPGKAVLTAIAALLTAAGYMHIANLVLIPASLFALAVRRGRRGAADAAFVLGASAFMLVPYAFFYGLYSASGFKEWLVWGSGLVNGQAPGASASGQFDLRFLANVPEALYTLFRSFIAVPENWRLKYAVAAAVAALCAWAAADRFKRSSGTGAALASLAFFAAIAGLYSVWIPGNIFYWASPLVFALFSGVLLFSSELRAIPSKTAALSVLLLAASAGVFNYRSVIKPNMEGTDVRPYLDFCAALEKSTPPDSVIIISGRRAGFLKVAIPYFARRRTIPLDLLFLQYYGTGQDPLTALRDRIGAAHKSGAPVFVSDDVLFAKDEFGAWGVTGRDMDAFLRYCRLKEAVRLGPSPPGILYLAGF